MNEVIAHIDISTPTGRRIVNELRKHTKTVRIEYLEPERNIEEGWHTVQEVFRGVEKKMNKHYGSNEKLKY